MEQANLQSWYQALYSRVVDLVGDFAGDELFIIEGDSLLRECFSNKKLDFSPGFQILHATYLVEKFLQKLKQRKCVFEIVFFTQNATLCIPPQVDAGLDDRYLLAREAIIQHLVSVSLQLPYCLGVKRFEGVNSKEFREDLMNSGVYLFLCHDGAYTDQSQNDLAADDEGHDDQDDEDDERILSDWGSDSESESGTNEDVDECAPRSERQETKAKTKLRLMIHWLISRGYNVALINSLEFRDTKVMAMVIEGSIKNRPSLLHESQAAVLESNESPNTSALGRTEAEAHCTAEAFAGADHFRDLLERAINEEPELTQRQLLLVVTLGSMLLDTSLPSIKKIDNAKALILHVVLLQDTRLEDRTFRACRAEDPLFFSVFLKVAKDVINSESWKETIKVLQPLCDIFDLADGRLLFKVQAMAENHGIDRLFSPSTLSKFNALASLVDHLCDTALECEAPEEPNNCSLEPVRTTSNESKPSQSLATTSAKASSFSKVLPFENTIFENHLKPVHLAIDKSYFDNDIKGSNKVFRDLTHWHKPKLLNSKKAPPPTPDQFRRYQRMNQRYMAEMEKYAKSLVGSTTMPQPETIVLGSANGPPQKSHSGKGRPNSGSKAKLQGRAEAPSSRELAAAAVKQKAAEGEEKQVARWIKKCHEFQANDEPVSRFKNVQEYLSRLPKDSRSILEPEILAYSLDTLVQVLISEHRNGNGGAQTNILIATHIWAIVARLKKLKQGISPTIAKFVNDPVAFLQAFSHAQPPDMGVGMSGIEFQLLHGGPLMERSMDSAPDPRTRDFDPDRWQREVLDQIDAKKSAFIVAPTSAGKTFISFYAMRQILKEDHEGVLVYVAPTKALVNQIAAEVLARFSKVFPNKATSKSVWAIHTRDYRINNPMGCQILITVPHILQIMLLAPSNAKVWTPRLRRIIFDEIHCIGQAEDGVVWEQLLLLSPCPIIALSATVGNPEEFENWLQHAQATNGYELKMIQHQHRYSDLRKYIFTPPQDFSFKGLVNPKGLTNLGLDEADGMTFIHPVVSLVDRSRGIPNDFCLEPRDCWTLWKAMHTLQTEQFPVDASLDPSIKFSGVIIQKKDVIEWQNSLKCLLKTWMKDRRSPFEDLLRQLNHDKTVPTSKIGDASVRSIADNRLSRDPGLLSTILPLVCSLHAKCALPALIFNYDRGMCEAIGLQLLNELREAEADWKSESHTWKTKIDKWNEWKKMQDIDAKRTAKLSKKKGGYSEIPRADQIRESASVEASSFELFDPERPLERFSFADFTKLSPSEFAEYADNLKFRGISEWLIDALERGIGIHHAGMNRKYRQTCEIMFRKGFLRVVIATGTLALGINMPCKTVVFAGDSIFLTALNFRQAAGRAGRRGFDMLGNVVFHHIPIPKIHRLITSRLPDLNGHFPLSTSLVLRMFILQHGSGQAESAVKSINSILSNPRICLGGPEMKETVLHYLRFSIEYLRRHNLITGTGAPLNFAGCISHLYYTESSSFAFHALLNSGYLHKLCKNINTKPKGTLRTLMLVMAHLFGRRPLRRAILESYYAAEKRASSVVVLPPLPKKAARVLQEHNDRVLDIYTGYVSTFIEQHVKNRDDCLPYSRIKCGGEDSADQIGLPQSNSISPRITSPFYALSGHIDKWKSVSDLCETVRSEVWLEASVVPFVDTSEESEPLNAYLYDFFKHGNVQQLERANGVRRSDMWFLLNDFSMVLATLTTSLGNFLSPTEHADLDIMNAAGGGDVNEFNVEEKLMETEENGMTNTQLPAHSKQSATRSTPAQKATRAGQNKVLDNWQDAMGDDDHDGEEAGLAEEKPDRDQQPGQDMEKDASRKSLFLVYQAFQTLKKEFDEKFQAMWA
ncbi:hypothetical protein N7512_006835 [Penicillium capsulatum]|nr:hypothetical protein N7512_006835 [Penicillium capsulatum]